MVMTPVESARSAIQEAVREFGSNLAVLTSFQREGVVIIDLIRQIAPQIPVLTIDTGWLPPATNQMISQIESRYGMKVERILPDPAEVDTMVTTRGAELFRTSVPERILCCNIRKVRPLAKRMFGVSAYFTGMRRAQTEERAEIEVFDRTSQPVKINPLADWTGEDVAEYTKTHTLPEHPLYAAGYRSIGCNPCTRATAAHEAERAGRWWWEADTAKECGLHFSADGRAERMVDVLLREVLERNPARDA